MGDDCQKLVPLLQACFPRADSTSQVAVRASQRTRSSRQTREEQDSRILTPGEGFGLALSILSSECEMCSPLQPGAAVQLLCHHRWSVQGWAISALAISWHVENEEEIHHLGRKGYCSIEN